MATYTQTGTTGSDSCTIASITGSDSTPTSGGIYRFDGLAGADTLTLSSSGGAYLDNFPRANFTIAPADSDGLITISGASAGGTSYIFELTGVEQVVFADQTVTLTYGGIADSLSNSELSFDLGVQSPELAASGQLMVMVASRPYGYLETVILDVSQLMLEGAHLTIPVSGTDANGSLYWLYPFSGDRLFVEIPAGVVVGEGAIAHAWQVGDISNNSFALTPMSVVTDGVGTTGADWVTGTIGNDMINAGAGDDVIEWSGGNDVVDAGDGYDMVLQPPMGMYYSHQLDAEGVLHIGSFDPYVSGSMSTVDAYRITKLSAASLTIDKMLADGATVDSTMVLSNAEMFMGTNLTSDTYAYGDTINIIGSPWDDVMPLDAANIENLMYAVWGDTGKDTLVLDFGAGYSKLELVRNSDGYVLQGTVGTGGTTSALAQAGFYPDVTMMSIGAGTNTTYIVGIEAIRFVSGTTLYEVDPVQFAEVFFQNNSWANSIDGTAKDDIIDADALGVANNATTYSDDIRGNGGDDLINAGAGDDTVYGNGGDDTIDGGLGNDSAEYNGNRSDYTITRSNGVLTVADTRADSPDGTDTLTGIERLGFYDEDFYLSVQFTPAYGTWSSNSITGSDFDDQIDADTLGAANPWKGSQLAWVYFGTQTVYTLGAYEFSDIGTVTFTAPELTNLTNEGVELWHGTDKVETSFTVSAADISNQTGGAYTLHWIGTATQLEIPNGSIEITFDKEVVYSHNDYIYGNGGDDLINAGGGDDSVYGNGGNDTIDGGLGNDSARYNGNRSDYTITNSNGVWSVVDIRDGSPDGTDTLTGIERLSFYDEEFYLAVQFTPAYAAWSSNSITGSGFNDQIDADTLGAANPWKGSQLAWVYFGTQTVYTLGAYEFSDIGTVTFTAPEITHLTNEGVELWHGTDKVETSFTVSAADISNQTGGAYTLHWIGTATQLEIPNGSIEITFDKEVVYSHNDYIYGNGGDDLINAGAGDDTVYGNGGDDTIDGGVGNDWIDGGDGNDTVIFSGNFAEYTVTHDVASSRVTITDHEPGRDGTDIVTSVENFRFADGFAPTLTEFSGAVGTTSEDTGTVEVTFASLQAQGDEADVDGTVEAFVVKSVSNGTLRIGADAASATPYSGWTNNTIDTAHHAWWTPAANVNGTLNAFAVVARDNTGLVSGTAIQATVMVTPVNDAPVIGFPASLEKVDYATGGYSYSVTMGDVNGDGKADLVVANYDSNTVSVLLGHGNGTFAPKVDYATGSYPSSVAIADFNGDSKTDLVATNYYGNTFSVLLNNGDGTFAAKVDYVAGDYSFSVTAGDFNGDGKADLVVINYYSQTISVLLNNGDGTFAEKVDYATGSYPYSVATGDFNGDGKADMAVTNYDSNTVSVLLGHGDGTFADKVDYATGGYSYGLATADFNSDGNADLVATNYYSNTVSVLLGHGDGTFADKVDYATGYSPFAVTTGDVNGDGITDLVATGSYYSNTVSVFLGYGNGTFAAKVDYAIGSYPSSVIAGDVNSDGKMDIVVANAGGSNTVSVLLNTATHLATAFTEQTPVVVSSTIIINDPDGDASWNGGSLSVQVSGNASLADSLSLASTAGIWLDTDGNKLMVGYTEIGTADAVLVTGDAAWHFTFNASATNDLVQQVARAISFNNSSDTPSVLDRTITIAVADNIGEMALVEQTVTVTPVNDAPTGSVTISGVSLPGETLTASNTIADPDGLGAIHYQWRADGVTISGATGESYLLSQGDAGKEITVVASYVDGGGTHESVAVNAAPHILLPCSLSFADKVDYATDSAPHTVILTDVNGDGKPDMVIANHYIGSISVLTNTGDGTFTGKMNFATGDYPASVVGADVNGDKHIDLVVTNFLSNSVSVLVNNGDGTFAEKVDYATASEPRSITSADVNGDGMADIVVTNQGSNTVSVLLNKGGGVFAEKVDYTTGSTPWSVSATDVNSDGKVDLFVADYGSNTVSVLVNKGDGIFAERVDYATGLTPFSVRSADVNGDGNADIVVVNRDSNTVSVLENKGDGTFADKVDYTTGSFPHFLHTVDVNGDGTVDIVVANGDSNTLSVLANKGDGTFADKVDYATGSWPHVVTSADVNGDGKADLVVANWSADTVSVLLNTFSAHTPTAFTEQTPVVVCNDIIISDPDGNANWNGGSLSVQVSGNASSADSLSFGLVPTPEVWLDTNGHKLMIGSTEIGTADAASVTGDVAWHFTFNASATNDLVQEVARAVTFNNSSDAPSVLDRTITFTVADHLGVDASVEQTVTVTAVNDPATFSGSSFGRIIKESGIYTAGGTLRVNDVDSDTTIHVQTDTTGAYGTFTIAADGVWSYVADTAKLDALGGATSIVTDTFGVTTADGTARNIVVTLMTPDAQGGILVNGLGGPADFGENFISRNDDSYASNIDITSVFGATGLNFLGTNYTTISINNNGNITFGGSGLYNFTPWAMQSASAYPMIAAFFADVDTRAYTNDTDGPGAVTPTPGGNSKGSNLTWYDFDPTGYGTLTVTWDDVGYYSVHTDKLNAFQMRLIGTGGGNFDVEFRYEDINWVTGDASGGSGGFGGTVVRAGYTAGNGSTYYELPQSGIQEQMLALDTTHGNTGLTGLYYFSLSNGSSITENQVIYGSDINSILTGGAGNDTLYGNSGDDILNGGAGGDMLYGSSGNDLYFINDDADSIVEYVNGGIDTVQTTVSYSLALLPDVENIRLVGSQDINAIGNDCDNTLISNSGSNVLDGGAGTDTASFELSRNPVDASLVSNSASGDGSDTLISIENLIGSIYNDNLTGNAGNNVLNGLNGADTITGLGGNDAIDGGAGDDTVVFSGNFADYAISFDGSSYTITDNVADRDGTDTVTGAEHFQFADGTRGDILPPTLISSIPTDEAIGVHVDSNLVLKFSEGIQRGIGAIEIHAGSLDGTVVESYDVATSSNLMIDGDTLTINPTADLTNSTHYFVTVSDGSINDLAGNAHAGTATYDFTTGAATLDRHDLGGHITFWKSGEAISDVTTTLSSMSTATGLQCVDFRNIQTAVDGSYTVEIWATSTSDIESLQLEFMLPTGSVATWQDAANLPTGWSSVANTTTPGEFLLGGIGTTALEAGQIKLGTLSLTAPANPEHFELLLNTGWLGDEEVAMSATTGSDGGYDYLDLHDGLYSLLARKDAGTFEHSAVTAADALAALKMAVVLNPNTESGDVLSYQYLAADVNHDGKVRAADALNILKMAVGLETAFHDEWIFVPENVGSELMSRNNVDWSDANISVDLSQNMELDLVGIVKGDVNGSWVA